LYIINSWLKIIEIDIQNLISITEAVPKSTNSNKLSVISDPNIELKNFSVGIVCTIFLTDRRIACCIHFNTGRSFVIGCGSKDKLISLNDLDIL
jgi:hypothetical protein